MIPNVFPKIISESLLSFYPAMVKFIQFPIINQTWARLIVYTIISGLFLNWRTIWPTLFSQLGLSLALVNVIHIISSYIGFANLEAGASYSIFYIYPILIILFSGMKFHWIYLLPIIGITLLSYSSWKNVGKENAVKGITGIIFATFTEVAMYFIVRQMKDQTNKWNILFIAYFLPALTISLILNKNVIPKPQNNSQNKWKKEIILLLTGNAIIGAIGYYLRFYTIDKLPVLLYSTLSYVGIIMAYIYGWILNKDKIGLAEIMGSFLIIISGILCHL